MTDTIKTFESAELFIPLCKLKKSPRNVRKVPHGPDAIEALAASVHAKGMLQNLVVEPELKDGEPTGCYLVTIGEGRRLAQLLRVKRKQIKKNEPIRCRLDTENDAGEISLDENVTRTAMHPADQFDAFHDLAVRLGLGAEDIAARFGVSAHVVRQRLRLAAVSPKLLQVYRDGDLSLEQLMAFAVTDDHTRQEEVFEALSYNQSPSLIRRELMRSSVPAHDRRARFVGAEAYQAAGGRIVRDLFEEDDGGYFEDTALLDRLALEKLQTVAAGIRAEGWNWAEAHIDYPHAHGMRRCYPHQIELCEDDAARLTQASEAYDQLASEYDGYDEMPEDVADQLRALEAEVDALIEKRNAYDPEDIARSGIFVVLGHDGEPRIERGFIRPDDEQAGHEGEVSEGDPAASADENGGVSVSAIKPLPDSLIRDLTAHRTLGLRLALGEQPDMALVALTHALVVQVFYHGSASCLEIRPRSEPLGSHASGIDDTKAGAAMAERHEGWAKQLPREVDDLWAFVMGMDQDSRFMLLAHCAALSVNAIKLPNVGKNLAQHGDDLARAVGLDMAQHWQAAPQGYFSRISKAQIVEAVSEAVSADAAARIAGLKKVDMVIAAEKLVAGTGWLPEVLRTPLAEVEVEPEGEAQDNAEVEPFAIAAE